MNQLKKKEKKVVPLTNNYHNNLHEDMEKQ